MKMKSTVILIDDPSKVDEIIKYTKNKDTQIFSLNYDTHKTLEKLKIKHEIGDNYLDSNELKDLDNYLIHLTLNWYQDSKIKDYLIYDSLNLGQPLEMEIVQYFTPFLLSIKSSLKIINIEKPNRIIAITKINKYLESYYEKSDIEIHSISISEKILLPSDSLRLKFNLKGMPLSIKISRKQFILIKNFFEKFLYRLFDLYDNSSNSNVKSILLCDFNTYNYADLLEELSKLDKKVLLLNTRRPSIWNYDSLKIILKNKCKIVNFQKYEKETRFNFKCDKKEFFINLKKLWRQDESFEKIFSFNSVSFWESIKPSFVQILNARFRDSIMRLQSFNLLFKKSNISLILEWAETAQEERELIHIAKKYNIKILFLQHAMAAIGDSYMKFGVFLTHLAHPLLSDVQTVWGESARDYALLNKFNKNIEVTGSPRHDKFFKNTKISNEEQLIIFAPTGPSEISCENSTTEKVLKFYDFVRETCKVIHTTPQKQLIVKPHSATTFSNEIVELVNELDQKTVITYTSDILNLVKNCELLITTNNSTIAIEAIILGKPVISLQSEDWALEEDIVKKGAVLSITNPCEIDDAIKKILNDENFKTKLLENGKNFLSVHFANHGTASAALAKNIKRFSDDS